MKKEESKRPYLISTLLCKCPRCRKGRMFRYGIQLSVKKNMTMNDRCEECGQIMDIEVGFYYGTGYVSYLVAFIISILSFFLWMFTIGFSFEDDRFFWWIGCNAVFLLLLQPWLMRYSRALWLSWFVKYDPDWKNTRPTIAERINKEQMSNW
jgi:uncharacterized protein (DUF983 family)